MTALQRINENPILEPHQKNAWEAQAAFNPSVIKDQHGYHLLYRALSFPAKHEDATLSFSSIGYAQSNDGIHFENPRQLIVPQYDWESYGCEDPRITKLGNKYYIFYTALSTYPFAADGIKVGVAMTEDFKTFKKHQVTPFNAKAMALFPEKIHGKFAAILTAHTDLPPSKIALAIFDKESDLWSPQYWKEWHANLDSHVIPLLRNSGDQIEAGAAPIKTKAGWLLIHSYIKNYFSSNKVFGIEATLLDLDNPLKVIGRTDSLLVPEKDYELRGIVPNIIFPTSAILQEDEVWVYYGAADTVGCLAKIKLNALLDELTKKTPTVFIKSEVIKKGFIRYNQNPIIEPRPEFLWEQKGTLNPASVYAENGVHIVYRAFSHDDTSTLGYAFSKDGLHIDERLPYPIYVPREPFETKSHPGFSGCEDPRITKIGNTLYMVYTAYDGNIPRVAMTSIKTKDFVAHQWNWTKPRIISAPNAKDKDAGIFPRTINGEYVILHRVNRSIYIDFADEHEFHHGNEYLTEDYLLLRPRADKWDNIKIGISPPPIETPMGWLLLYHGYSDPGAIYKVGAALLDLQDPRVVLSRLDIPLFVPEMNYEKSGFVHNVVFPCGTVMKGDDIYLYYGGGDFVIGVAIMSLTEILTLF